MKTKLKYSLIVLLISEIIFWGIGSGLYIYFSGLEDFKFEKESYLKLLFVLRVLVLGFILAQYLLKSRLEKYASNSMLGKIGNNFSSIRNSIKFSFLLIGISCLIIGLANPQFGKKEVEMSASGIDMIIGIDVSNSMLAKDLSPNFNRLEVTKLAIKNLLNQLSGDRVGVVVFAGTAYSYIPITNDYEYIKQELNSINPGMLSAQGTSISSAIEVSLESFGESTSKKAILVFSDGENHEENAIDAAEKAIKNGVKIYTIGMGTNKAVPIPMNRFGNEFHKDKSGNTVMTKLNEDILKKISREGKGKYLRANKTKVNTERIIKDINKLEKTTFKKKSFLEYEDKFQWALGFGLLFLLINVLIGKLF
ncbi:MAG: VWA domain-containing protein [Flavobacteriales bacterium]